MEQEDAPMKKRWMALLLAAVLVLPLLPLQADAAFYYEYDQREEVNGSDYTTSAKMAQKLNAIFDGNANIYHDKKCTNAVNVRIGTSNVKNNGVYMYAGPYGGPSKNSGTSCWIYAAGVYYTLFGEVGFQNAGKNSVCLDLSGTSNKTMNYSNFRAWGVRDTVGAHVRTTSHSMIILEYNEDGITVVDGNNDGKGKVSVRKVSWNYMAKYTINYITQPKEEFYNSEYPVYDCQHEYMLSDIRDAGCVEDGVYTYSCGKCGDSYTESIPATGHNFENDYCTVCGAYDSSVITGTCGGDLSWTLRSGTLTVSGTGDMYDYLDGGAPWFKNTTSIKAVVLEDGVAGVGDNAFTSCENLASVTVGNSVTRIGDFAFQSCSRISALTLGSSVETIGLEAFKYTAITTLDFPDSTAYIGDMAFGFCTALTQVRFGKGLTTLGDGAFYYAPNLKEITFRSSAPAIGDEAFVAVKATANYPANDATWTGQVMGNYGGTLTWKAYQHGLDLTSGAYYDEGVVQGDYTGLVTQGGSTYYVAAGYVDWDYRGLYLADDTWYYLEQGQVKQDYTGLAEYDDQWYYVQSDDRGCTVTVPEFTGVSVALDAVLGVNFRAPAGLTVTVEGQSVTSDTGVYTVSIMAADLAKPITATLSAEGQVLDQASFSMADYVAAIGEQEDQTVTTLAKAALSYCQYAARAEETYAGTLEPLADIGSDAFGAYPFDNACQLAGVSLYARLTEACQLRLRLSSADYTVYVDNAVVPAQQSGDTWVYGSAMILPQDYDAQHSFLVAQDGIALYRGQFSVLAYLGYCLENGVGTADEQNLMKAMYHYYAAAQAYLDAA